MLTIVAERSKGPHPLEQCRFPAEQFRRFRHSALRVFKWMPVYYSGTHFHLNTGRALCLRELCSV
jgi:hypothetical protein